MSEGNSYVFTPYGNTLAYGRADLIQIMGGGGLSSADVSNYYNERYNLSEDTWDHLFGSSNPVYTDTTSLALPDVATIATIARLKQTKTIVVDLLSVDVVMQIMLQMEKALNASTNAYKLFTNKYENGTQESDTADTIRSIYKSYFNDGTDLSLYDIQKKGSTSAFANLKIQFTSRLGQLEYDRNETLQQYINGTGTIRNGRKLNYYASEFGVEMLQNSLLQSDSDSDSPKLNGLSCGFSLIKESGAIDAKVLNIRIYFSYVFADPTSPSRQIAISSGVNLFDIIDIAKFREGVSSTALSYLLTDICKMINGDNNNSLSFTPTNTAWEYGPITSLNSLKCIHSDTAPYWSQKPISECYLRNSTLDIPRRMYYIIEYLNSKYSSLENGQKIIIAFSDGGYKIVSVVRILIDKVDNEPAIITFQSKDARIDNLFPVYNVKSDTIISGELMVENIKGDTFMKVDPVTSSVSIAGKLGINQELHEIKGMVDIDNLSSRNMKQFIDQFAPLIRNTIENMDAFIQVNPFTSTDQEILNSSVAGILPLKIYTAESVPIKITRQERLSKLNASIDLPVRMYFIADEQRKKNLIDISIILQEAQINRLHVEHQKRTNEEADRRKWAVLAEVGIAVIYVGIAIGTGGTGAVAVAGVTALIEISKIVQAEVGSVKDLIENLDGYSLEQLEEKITAAVAKKTTLITESGRQATYVTQLQEEYKTQSEIVGLNSAYEDNLTAQNSYMYVLRFLTLAGVYLERGMADIIRQTNAFLPAYTVSEEYEADALRYKTLIDNLPSLFGKNTYKQKIDDLLNEINMNKIISLYQETVHNISSEETNFIATMKNYSGYTTENRKAIEFLISYNVYLTDLYNKKRAEINNQEKGLIAKAAPTQTNTTKTSAEIITLQTTIDTNQEEYDKAKFTLEAYTWLLENYGRGIHKDKHNLHLLTGRCLADSGLGWEYHNHSTDLAVRANVVKEAQLTDIPSEDPNEDLNTFQILGYGDILQYYVNNNGDPNMRLNLFSAWVNRTFSNLKTRQQTKVDNLKTILDASIGSMNATTDALQDFTRNNDFDAKTHNLMKSIITNLYKMYTAYPTETLNTTQAIVLPVTVKEDGTTSILYLKTSMLPNNAETEKADVAAAQSNVAAKQSDLVAAQSPVAAAQSNVAAAQSNVAAKQSDVDYYENLVQITTNNKTNFVNQLTNIMQLHTNFINVHRNYANTNTRPFSYVLEVLLIYSTELNRLKNLDYWVTRSNYSSTLVDNTTEGTFKQNPPNRPRNGKNYDILTFFNVLTLDYTDVETIETTSGSERINDDQIYPLTDGKSIKYKVAKHNNVEPTVEYDWKIQLMPNLSSTTDGDNALYYVLYTDSVNPRSYLTFEFNYRNTGSSITTTVISEASVFEVKKTNKGTHYFQRPTHYIEGPTEHSMYSSGTAFGEVAASRPDFYVKNRDKYVTELQRLNDRISSAEIRHDIAQTALEHARIALATAEATAQTDIATAQTDIDTAQTALATAETALATAEATPTLTLSGRSLNVDIYTRDQSYRDILLNLITSLTASTQLVNYSTILFKKDNTLSISERIQSDALFTERFGSPSLFVVIDNITEKKVVLSEEFSHWNGKESSGLLIPGTNIKLDDVYAGITKAFIAQYGFNPTYQTVTNVLIENMYIVPYKYDDQWKLGVMRYYKNGTILYRIWCSIEVNDYISQSIITRGDSTLYGDLTLKSVDETEIFHIDTLNKIASNMYPLGIGTNQPKTMLDIQDTSIFDVTNIFDTISTRLNTMNGITISDTSLNDTTIITNLNSSLPSSTSTDDYYYVYKIDMATKVAGDVKIMYHGTNSSWIGHTYTELLNNNIDLDNSEIISKYILPSLQKTIDETLFYNDSIYTTLVSYIYGLKYSMNKVISITDTNEIYIVGSGLNIQQYNINAINNPNVALLFEKMDELVKYVTYTKYKRYDEKYPTQLTNTNVYNGNNILRFYNQIYSEKENDIMEYSQIQLNGNLELPLQGTNYIESKIHTAPEGSSSSTLFHWKTLLLQNMSPVVYVLYTDVLDTRYYLQLKTDRNESQSTTDPKNATKFEIKYYRNNYRDINAVVRVIARPNVPAPVVVRVTASVPNAVGTSDYTSGNWVQAYTFNQSTNMAQTNTYNLRIPATQQEKVYTAYTTYTTGNNTDTYLRVYIGNAQFGYNDDTIGYNDDTIGLNASLQFTIPANHDCIVAYGLYSSYTGLTTLRLDPLVPVVSVTATSVPNAVGTSDYTSGNWVQAYTFNQDTNSAQSNTYNLSIQATQQAKVYTAYTTGNTDTYLRVYIGNAQFGYNDDGGFNYNTSLQFTIPANHDCIVAYGMFSSNTGSTTLRLDPLVPVVVPVTATSVPNAVGTSDYTSGNWELYGTFNQNTNFAQTNTYNLSIPATEQAKVYTAYTTGNTDTYLRVYIGNEQHGYNDDTIGLNARLQFTIPANHDCIVAYGMYSDNNTGSTMIHLDPVTSSVTSSAPVNNDNSNSKLIILGQIRSHDGNQTISDNDIAINDLLNNGTPIDDASISAAIETPPDGNQSSDVFDWKILLNLDTSPPLYVLYMDNSDTRYYLQLKTSGNGSQTTTDINNATLLKINIGSVSYFTIPKIVTLNRLIDNDADKPYFYTPTTITHTLSYGLDNMTDYINLLNSRDSLGTSDTHTYTIVNGAATYLDHFVGSIKIGQLNSDVTDTATREANTRLIELHTSFMVQYFKLYDGDNLATNNFGVVSTKNNNHNYITYFYKYAYGSNIKIDAFFMNITEKFLPSSVSLNGDMTVSGSLNIHGKNDKYITIDPENNFFGINTNDRFINYSNTYGTTSSVYNTQRHGVAYSTTYPNFSFERVSETPEDPSNPSYTRFGSYSASTMVRVSKLWNYNEIMERVNRLNVQKTALSSDNYTIGSLKTYSNNNYNWKILSTYGPDISFEVTDNTGLTTELGQLKMVIDKKDASNNLHAGFGVQVVDTTMSSSLEISLKNILYVNNDSQLFVEGVWLGGKLLYEKDGRLIWGETPIILEQPEPFTNTVVFQNRNIVRFNGSITADIESIVNNLSSEHLTIDKHLPLTNGNYIRYPATSQLHDWVNWYTEVVNSISASAYVLYYTDTNGTKQYLKFNNENYGSGITETIGDATVLEIKTNSSGYQYFYIPTTILMGGGPGLIDTLTNDKVTALETKNAELQTRIDSITTILNTNGLS